MRPLWQYVKDATVYKFPADQSQALYNGILYPRIRSYSMNLYLGGTGGGNKVSSGAWSRYFPLYFKLTDIGSLGMAPGPNQTFVFIDERSDCINWGNFETDFSGYPLTPSAMPQGAVYQWTADLPSSYHNLAANLSFADGHSECHRWKVASTYPPLAVGQSLGPPDATWPVPFSQDVAWMQSVSARPH